MSNLFIGTALTVLVLDLLIAPVNGCHVIEHNEDDEYAARRKRSTVEESEIEMRAFFAKCIKEEIGAGENVTFNTEVDFVVLDTLWYVDASTIQCSDDEDSDSVECWQEVLENLLVEGELLNMTKSCVQKYSEQNSDNDETVTTSTVSRKRRSTEDDSYWQTYGANVTEQIQYRHFGNCLSNDSSLSSSYQYDKLSAFVQKQVLSSCDLCNERQCRKKRSNVAWYNRITMMSSPASRMRSSSYSCARAYTPKRKRKAKENMKGKSSRSADSEAANSEKNTGNNSGVKLRF